MAKHVFAALIPFTTVACAEPVVLQCTILSSPNTPEMFAAVNQIVIDRNAPSVELRVANPEWTEQGVNWIFTNNEKLGDKIEVKAVDGVW